MSTQNQSYDYEENGESYAGAPLDEKTSRLSITLDDSDILIDIYRSLRGIIETRDGNTTRLKEQELVNEKGARAIIINLRGRIDKAAKLGYLDQEHKNRLMKGIAKTVIVMIAENHEEFGIDVTRRTDITWLILDMVDINLTRALGGKERDLAYIDKQIQELYQKTDHKQTIQGKRFSMFSGGGSGREQEAGYE